jgi:hypothetical protein
MREQLDKNIKNYTEALNDSFKDMSKEGKQKAEIIKEVAVQEGAFLAHTTKEAELEIYKIQKQKIEKFRKFKQWLEKTRKNSETYDDTENKKDKPVVSLSKEGTVTISYKDGSFKIATMGEVMTDMEWGSEYAFDKSVDIHDIRKYHLMQLKKELRDKLDAQIIESETSNTYVDTAKQTAYKQIKERTGNDSAQMEKTGVVAEKMVSTFLEQLSVDCPDADFSITPADAFQDVDEKIDFIIRRKEHRHGARIEESEADTGISGRTIGIQFTTAEGKNAHKEGQLNKAKKHATEVDDIVLVTIPMSEATYLYKKWQEKKDPGGPTKYWNKNTKINVFKAVMQNVLEQDEIEEFCNKYFK